MALNPEGQRYPVQDRVYPGYYVAKFKGETFFCESSADEFGRRGHLYEYPLGEVTGYKDLGRKAARFKLEGYLIGADQLVQSMRFRMLAETPEPGMLVHPLFGVELVACVTLSISADYRKDKKRTKLAFEFVEAKPSNAPWTVGAALSLLKEKTDEALGKANEWANKIWSPTPDAAGAGGHVSDSLSRQVEPGKDEASHDAIDRLNPAPPPTGNSETIPALFDIAHETLTLSTRYPKFSDYSGPVDAGTATIRRIHLDALRRLRNFNHYVVTKVDVSSQSILAVVITARLALARDYALVAASTTYKTVHAALSDLDFVVALYDEEEAAATAICQDELVTAIRTARAAATQTILQNNIRLPGIVLRNAEGVWPSLVVAQKMFFDGKRFEEIESYNPHMMPFAIGRSITVPAT